MTWQQCQYQLDVNLVGAIRITKCAIPLLKKTKGRIVNISSFSGHVALPYRSVYCASKFGLEGFSDSLRIELKRYGIHVAVVSLGNHSRLTRICREQMCYVGAMWSTVPQGQRNRCSCDFWNPHYWDAKTAARCGGPTSYKHTTLLHDIQHAVASPDPCARYISGTLKDIVLYRLVTWLPSAFRDRLFSVHTSTRY